VRAGVAALSLVAVVLGSDVTDALARPPGPPPLAFRSATLDGPLREIDVHMQAMEEIPVRVRISRQGQLIGTGGGDVHVGQSAVSVRVGPKTMRRLHPGQHVTVRIAYGAPEPLVVPNAVLHRSLDLTL
jgi:hypothetical protein